MAATTNLSNGGSPAGFGRRLGRAFLGPADTWLPAAALEEAGVEIAKKARQYRTIDGRYIRRDVGYAVLKCQDFETAEQQRLAFVAEQRDD